MTDPFGVYVHVPFCAVRCGYCDFNTYTAAELGPGASQDEYAGSAVEEMRLAGAHLDLTQDRRPATSVFFGGGTPTLLPIADVRRMLAGVREVWGITPDAEVSIEANPDSVGLKELTELREAGFTRVSFGMQSAVPHVLATLDRTHDPARLPLVTGWARDAGLEYSIDLIYGTPGESIEDWRRSVEAALDLGSGHISAYALTIEPGTRMGAQVRRGDLPGIDPDDQAEKYELADEAFMAAGYRWYEISNWAKTPQQRSQHNLGYWRNIDWWGIGPGAHSHIRGTRFWNVKHPRPYAAQVLASRLPIAEKEELTGEQKNDERVLLGIRLAEGLQLSSEEQGKLPALVERGLVEPDAAARGIVRLTRRGRMLADSVAMEILL